jgi:hypothetical protein
MEISLLKTNKQTNKTKQKKTKQKKENPQKQKSQVVLKLRISIRSSDHHMLSALPMLPVCPSSTLNG